MNAAEVMTHEVVTVAPDTPLREVARTLVRHAISGVPVVDEAGKVVGMLSEADLIPREGIARDQRASSWLELIAEGEALAPEYVSWVRSGGRCARDVMSKDVVAIREDTPISEIAGLMMRHRVKRLPVLRDGRLVGIVSRANLVENLAHAEERRPTPRR